LQERIVTASESRLPQPAQTLPLPGLLGKLQEWLYLPPGFTDPLRRCTGLCSLIILVMVAGWTWSFGSGVAVPYCVPAWRWQDHLLVLPMPPEWLFISLFTAAILSCLWLMFGSRKKVFIWIILAVFGYFGSRELCSISSNWASIDVCLLVALLFDRPEQSCTRRLIQISICFCYLFSALQKIFYPDFLNGNSFAAQFENGFMIRPLFVPFIKSLALPMIAWQVASWLTIAFETYLGLALFSKKLRKQALILGTAFHVAIVVFLIDYIITFSLVMLTGYLAFIDREQDEQSASAFRTKPLEFALALAFIAAISLIPLRLYVWPGRSPDTIVQFDRAPWTYNMFVLRADTKAFNIKFKDANGQWREIVPVGRMKYASSDNELYSLRNYIFATYPGTTEIQADLKLRINERWDLEKTMHATAGGDALVTARRLQ
jgi:Vitamin K-dependent gamma-carboxylase